VRHTHEVGDDSYPRWFLDGRLQAHASCERSVLANPGPVLLERLWDQQPAPRVLAATGGDSRCEGSRLVCAEAGCPVSSVAESVVLSRIPG
jgi:hypothetical protein